MRYFLQKMTAVLLLLWVASSCVSQNKMLEQARRVHQAGSPCGAIDLYLMRLADKPSHERDQAVREIGQACVEREMAQARELDKGSRMLQGYEEAYKVVEQARQRLSQLNATFGNLLLWKAEDEAFRQGLVLKISEGYYQLASGYQSARQYDQAERAFQQVLQWDPHYKDAAKRQQDSYDSQTEELYLEAVSHFEQRQYERARGSFELVQQRNPSYKQVQEYQIRTYDMITKEGYDKAVQLMQQKRYRAAYDQFTWVSDRERVGRLSDLQQHMLTCLDQGSLKIYLKGVGKDLQQRLASDLDKKIGNPFLRFVFEEKQAQYPVQLNVEFEASQGNVYRSRKPAFLIEEWIDERKVMQRDSTYRIERERMYRATKGVEYAHMEGSKTMKCFVDYRIGGTFVMRHLENEVIDRVDVFETLDGRNPAHLSPDRLEPRNRPIEPSRDWVRRFQGKSSFDSDYQLRQSAMDKVYPALLESLRKELGGLLAINQ